MGSEASSFQLVPRAWCLKFKKIFKVFYQRSKKNPRVSLTGKRTSSKLLRISITESCASFTYRHHQQKKTITGAEYTKLKLEEKLSMASSSSSSSSKSGGSSADSFSFRNRGKPASAEQKRGVKSDDPVEVVDASTLKLGEKWREVVEMVTMEGSFDDLIDLEEFLGYYLLLRSPEFTSLVHSFFNEFCSEFCEEESRVISLFIPELQDFPSFGSSEREYERLPPTPCSKQQSFKRLK